MGLTDEELKDFWDNVRSGKLQFTKSDQCYFNFKIADTVRNLQRRVKELESLISKEGNNND